MWKFINCVMGVALALWGHAAETSLESYPPRLSEGIIAEETLSPEETIRGIKEVWQALAQSFGSLTSLEYSGAATGCNYPNKGNSVKTSLPPASIHLIINGEKYWYDVKPPDSDGRNAFAQIMAFDGMARQSFHQSSQRMYIEKGEHDTEVPLLNHNYLLFPFECFAEELLKKRAYFVHPKIVSDWKRWEALISCVKIVGITKLDGKAMLVS